ncbi:MAG: hypothetical protein ACI32F_06050, partial [Allobaculum sp.]
NIARSDGGQKPVIFLMVTFYLLLMPLLSCLIQNSSLYTEEKSLLWGQAERAGGCGVYEEDSKRTFQEIFFRK